MIQHPPLHDESDYSKLDSLIEHLLDRSRMQLMMGELTMEEYLAAKAAVRYTITQLEQEKLICHNK